MIPYLIRMHTLACKRPHASKTVIERFCGEIPQLGAFYSIFCARDVSDKERIIRQAYRVFAALLQSIARYAQDQAYTSGIKLERVAFTIPSNWDNWTQRLVLKVIGIVWPMVSTYDIHIIYEAEAVGHYLFRLGNIRAKKRPLRVLIIDWGGHTLNTAIVELQPGKRGIDTGPVFFDVENIYCEHLGSALYVSALKQHIIQQIDQNEEVKVAKKHRDRFIEGVLNDFLNRKLQGLHKGQKSMELVGDVSPQSTVLLAIDQATLDQLYTTYIDKGVKKIRRLMTKIVRDKANSLVDFDISVFANGGTLRNQHIHDELASFARKKGISYINSHMDHIPGDYRSIVSRGAALAVANSASLRDYMTTSIFAIRPRNSMPVTEKVPVIWNSGKSYVQRLNLDGQHGATVSLVCQPFACDKDATEIPLHKTFQLEVMPQLKKGSYEFSMSFRLTSDRENKGVITLKYWIVESETLVTLPTQTLYFDPSSTVAFIERSAGEPIHNLDDEQFHQKGSHLYRKWQEEQLDKGSDFWREAVVDDVKTPKLDAANLAYVIECRQLEPIAKAPHPSSYASMENAVQSSGSRSSKRVAPTRLSISEGITSQRKSKKSTLQAPKSKVRDGLALSNHEQSQLSSKGKGKQPQQRPDTSWGIERDTEGAISRAHRILQPNPNLACDPGQTVVISDSGSSQDDDSDDDDRDDGGNEKEADVNHHSKDNHNAFNELATFTAIESQLATTRVGEEPLARANRNIEAAPSTRQTDPLAVASRSRISISRTSSRPSNVAEMQKLFRKSLPGDREPTQQQLQELVQLVREAFHWRRALEAWVENNLETLYN
ncbi:hypothetical protein VHEMI03108 [[Torrubiella] hemipterigena]|nr:hypothetical protein VHEMI03108 [[Torrubiella] hemipterigena]